MELKADDLICDIGAGTAHLTLALAKAGYSVVSVEPNTNMRELGIQRTREYRNVRWVSATGEDTGQADTTFGAVTFGSSFNVLDRSAALKEFKRIALPKGWLAAMWNHRDLSDPIQSNIENIIQSHIRNYEYGTRREDQTKFLNDSGLFSRVEKIEYDILHEQSRKDIVEAWRSHATLQRQAGNRFSNIIKDIEHYLSEMDSESIHVPYTTRIWLAQLNN